MTQDCDNKIKYLIEKIHKESQIPLTLMEVCGTHTMSIARHAIRSLLPKNIRIVSGPGCPVCVTSSNDLQIALKLAQVSSNIICTFGDMIKIPCNNDHLGNYKNVKIIYSPLEAIDVAQRNPSKNIILLGIGFETTAPLISSTIQIASKKKIENFTVLSMHKTVPVALRTILSDPESSIDGLILPGHVSAITGRKYFDFITELGTCGVIAGFEPLDIMECIYLLVDMINQKKCAVLNNYERIVSENGNETAMKTIDAVFINTDSSWRGIGTIPQSGLAIHPSYEQFDALKRFEINVTPILEPHECRCGEILMAKTSPLGCKLFGKQCTPATPVGPCMVSSEGTCAAYYKYN